MNQDYQPNLSNLKSCTLCPSTTKLLIFNNDLILCKTCLHKYKKSASHTCQHCKTPCTSFLPCKHLLCSLCASSSTMPKYCILCMIKCCYCKSKQARNSKSICLQHKNCIKCAQQLKNMQESCLICQDKVEKFTCSKCKKVDFSTFSQCGTVVHGLCSTCLKDLSFKCYKCELCFYCNKSSNKESPCEHKLINDPNFNTQKMYESTEPSMYNTKASSEVVQEERKICIFCNNEYFKYFSFPCGHICCYECRGKGFDECILCEQCTDCYIIANCQKALCGHKLCQQCIKKSFCSVCIKKNTFIKCCACRGLTLKQNLKIMTCSHKICSQCSENSIACSKCSRRLIIDDPEKCCYCDNPAWFFVENGDNRFHMCQSHYYEVGRLHEIFGESLVVDIENDRKDEILENIDYQINALNDLSANVVKNTNDIMKRINEAVKNTVKKYSEEIKRLMGLKNDVILSDKIRKSYLEMVSRKSTLYLFKKEIRMDKLAEELCGLISTNLVEENFQDKYLSYYSPSRQGLVRLSLKNFSTKLLPNNPNSFITGTQNQIVKINSSSYFICGGLNKTSLSTAYMLNMKSLTYKQLPSSHIPISKSSSIYIDPYIYMFLSTKKQCIIFNLSTKEWNLTNFMPEAYTNGTACLYNSKILLCGTELENILIFFPQHNIYEKGTALNRGLKIFCDSFLLTDGDGIYKVLDKSLSKVHYSCDLNCNGLMTSCIGKRGGKYYFVGSDEKVTVFDSFDCSVKVVYNGRKVE